MEQQMQQMMELVNKQMELVTRLTAENSSLRQQPSSVRRPDRPAIETNSSDNDWALFLDSWNRYKCMARIEQGEGMVMELRSCCSAEVNKLLFDFVGPVTLNNATETSLLGHIKSVAVKGVHKEVHRLTFVNMRQTDNEPIVKFVARLQAQAALCDFTVACSTEGCQRVSYAEDMISQQVTAGLTNPEFQSKILSEASILTTLANKVERLQMLESTEESTLLMQPTQSSGSDPSNAAPGKSQYQRRKQVTPQTKDRREYAQTSETRSNVPENRKCQGCGRQSHPAGKSMRRTDCPAYSKKCDACGTTGHFKSVCRKSRGRSTRYNDSEDNDGTSDEGGTLASASTLFL
jgi:hypothetical protein